MAEVKGYLKPVLDVLITLLAWLYFFFGYVILFILVMPWAYSVSRNLEIAVQRLNHLFYKIFFVLLQAIPGVTLRIPQDLDKIRSSVIVCNHASYLDPILLISLFDKHKTIVRSDLFRLPIFGQLLKLAGYIPSSAADDTELILLRALEGMGDFLAAGGNLFIFPEGTRSLDGTMGPFNKGAFKIARQCRAPIEIFLLKNTEKLLRPGRFWFNTCVPVAIEVVRIGSLKPDYRSESFSLSGLMEEVRALMQTSKG